MEGLGAARLWLLLASAAVTGACVAVFGAGVVLVGLVIGLALGALNLEGLLWLLRAAQRRPEGSERNRALFWLLPGGLVFTGGVAALALSGWVSPLGLVGGVTVPPLVYGLVLPTAARGAGSRD